MFVFTLSLFIKLVTHGDDSISTIVSQQNIEELEDIILDDSGFHVSYMMSLLPSFEPVIINDETRRYIEF